MIDDAILAQAANVLARCRAAGLRLATAESCTGGLVAGALTAIAGSSDVVERGFVTYSNAAKTELLGVPAELIVAEGAVSEPVARRMAEGALAHSAADLAVSVTGIAGPGGGSAEKPVGLVWFGLARRGAATRTLRQVFPGDRGTVRAAAVAQALALLGGTQAGGGGLSGSVQTHANANDI
jgi:nicotinamide-nucleotide amidase